MSGDRTQRKATFNDDIFKRLAIIDHLLGDKISRFFRHLFTLLKFLFILNDLIYIGNAPTLFNKVKCLFRKIFSGNRFFGLFGECLKPYIRF